MIDEKTSVFAWPLPHAQNPLNVDVERLRQGLQGIDQALGEIHSALETLNTTLATYTLDGGTFNGN